MEIECTFGNQLSLSCKGSGSFYTCTVQSSITKPGTRVTSCIGEHQAGKSNTDVEAINFTSIVVEHFPLGLGKIFPNAKELRVNSCGLKEISRRGLIGLENLIGIWLYSNPLQSLPDNLLSGMKKIADVYFGRNKLEFVSSNLLQPIKKNNKQVYVDFRHNPTPIGFYQLGKSGSLGSLQELCDIIDKTCKRPMGERQDLGADKFSKRMFKGFKALWTSGRLSDFVIVCGSREFKVHRSVLMIQSSVLAAVVDGDMKESKTGRMEIVDFSSEAVEEFLKYLYTGDTPDQTNAMEMFALASKYDVPELKFLMEEIVLCNIDEPNALEILNLGKQIFMRLTWIRA